MPVSHYSECPENLLRLPLELEQTLGGSSGDPLQCDTSIIGRNCERVGENLVGNLGAAVFLRLRRLHFSAGWWIKGGASFPGVVFLPPPAQSQTKKVTWKSLRNTTVYYLYKGERERETSALLKWWSLKLPHDWKIVFSLSLSLQQCSSVLSISHLRCWPHRQPIL